MGETYNGSANWETFEFCAWVDNREPIYRDVLTFAQNWLDTSPHGDLTELGRAIVAHVRENWEGARTGHGERAFFDLNGSEWDAIDLREVGEGYADALKDGA